MPAAGNLVVKNAAGTDKTFTLLSPAPGYGAFAEWALREGATSVQFPSFGLSATRTTNKSRKTTLKIRKPATYVSVTTGLPVVSSVIEANIQVSVPDDFPDDQKDDAIAYVTGLLSTALVKSCMRDGLPAT